MCTAFTHAFVAAAFGKAAFPQRMPLRFWVLALGCSALPDLDVGLHAWGVDYHDLWGHRGIMHSLLFALTIALIVTLWPMREWARPIGGRRWWGMLTFFFLITASHGFIDAFTDGGLGIAFLAPLSNERFFMPWNPIAVPMLGLSSLADPYMLEVLRSEVLWVWLPTIVITAPIIAWRILRRRRVKSAA